MLVLSLLPILGLVFGTITFWGLHQSRIEDARSEVGAIADAELLHMVHGELAMVHSQIVGYENGFLPAGDLPGLQERADRQVEKLRQELAAREADPETLLNDADIETLGRTLRNLESVNQLMQANSMSKYGFTESNAFARDMFDLAEIWNQAELGLDEADLIRRAENAQMYHNYLLAYAEERSVVMQEAGSGAGIATSIDVVERIAAASGIRAAAFDAQRASGFNPFPVTGEFAGVDPGSFFRPWSYGLIDGSRTDRMEWFVETERVLMTGDRWITDTLADIGSNRKAAVQKSLRDRNVNAAFALGVLVLAGGLVWLTMREIADRRRVERAHEDAIQDLTWQATRDSLTGIWNRGQLDRLIASHRSRAQPDESIVLAYIDLDEFKPFNDVWGREQGDRVLRRIAERLKMLCGDGWSIVRFGGDEFVVVGLMERPSIATVADFGRRIVDEIALPIGGLDRMIMIEATVGLTMDSQMSESASEILLEADAAMVLAKKRQRGSALVYDRENQREAKLLRALPKAIEDGELGAWFQPAYDMATNECVAVEALARWTRSDGQMISPGEFIPLAESYGLMSQLTSNILHQAAMLLREPAFPETCRVWINVSAVELDSRDFSDQFVSSASKFNIDLARLGVEITETAAIRHPANLRDALRRLRHEGVQIAIDDFGNGYSPLGYLREIPFDVLKLDRSIVSHIDSQRDLQLMVQGIVGMMGQLGVEIVAEGIERVEEFRWLASLGVDTAQGFLLAKPVPHPDLLETLARPLELPEIAPEGPVLGAVNEPVA